MLAVGFTETNWAMSFFRTPFDEGWSIAESFACLKQVCPCLKLYTVEIKDRQVQIMSNGYVTLKGMIKTDGVCCHEEFGGRSFDFPKCAHDIDNVIFAYICKDHHESMDTCMASKHDRFIRVHAVLNHGYLDRTGNSAGVICSPDLRVDNPDQSA